MAAHRYWKTVALEASGAGLIEVSEFWLLAGTTRVDAAATLSGSVPVSGALSSLQDDDLATGVVLPARAFLAWDFGVGGGADVTDIRIGAADDAKKFPVACGLAYSDDGVTWSVGNYFAGILWPGRRAKTVSEQLGNLRGIRLTSITSSGSPRVGSTTFDVWDNNGAYLPGLPAGAGVRQFEVSRTAIVAGGIAIAVGVSARFAIDTQRQGGNTQINGTPGVWYQMTATKVVNGSVTAYGATWTTGDVIQCVVDLSSGNVTFYKNGVSQGVAGTISLANGDIHPNVVAAGSAGAVNYATVAMRTRGFTNAIAGATPWEDRIAIATNAYGFKSTSEGFNFVPSLGYAPPAAAQPIAMPARLRPEYAIGAAAGGAGRMIGRVKGTTKDKGTPNVPVSERVRLYREQDGLLIREVWSAPGTGAYSFDYIDETQTYTVLAYDHDKSFRAVVADNLTLAGGGVELLVEVTATPIELRVRNAQQLTILDNGTSIVLPLPTALAGDLLVAVVMSRSTASTPAGWTLRSASTQASGSGVTQETLIYTRTATSSEPSSYTFTQSAVGRMNGQILTLTSPLGTPVFNTEAHAVKNNSSDAFMAIPAATAVSPGSKNQIAIAAISSVGNFPVATVMPNPWVEVQRAGFSDERLAVGYKRLGLGETTSGSMTFTGSGGNAISANAAIFTDP